MNFHKKNVVCLALSFAIFNPGVLYAMEQNGKSRVPSLVWLASQVAAKFQLCDNKNICLPDDVIEKTELVRLVDLDLFRFEEKDKQLYCVTRERDISEDGQWYTAWKKIDEKPHFKQHDNFKAVFNKINILDATERLLIKVPNAIFYLKQLGALDLSDNQLTEILAAIGELTQLKFLSLKNNQLKTIPVEIEKLQELYMLLLQNNRLEMLPNKAIQKLPKLTFLDISNNHNLQEFPLIKYDVFIPMSRNGTDCADLKMDWRIAQIMD